MQLDLSLSHKTMNGAVVAIDWCISGQENGNSVNPCLAICYDNGQLVLLRSATDPGTLK